MRRLAPLLLLVALAAGCGASDPVAAEEVSAAVAKTAESGSSRMEIEGIDDGAEIVMRGVADHEVRRASFSFDMTPKSGEAAQRGDLRVLGATMYASSSLFGVAAAPGEKKPKPWYKLEYDEDEGVSLDRLLFPFPFVDPGRILATFKRVSGAVETLGEETVRGVPTTRYRLTLDLARLIETASEQQRAQLREELEGRERKTAPVEVSIDDVGLARRIRFVIDGDPVSIDFFDFGIAVDVQAPPAAEVEDLDLLFAGEETSEVGEIEEVPAEEDE